MIGRIEEVRIEISKGRKKKVGYKNSILSLIGEKKINPPINSWN